MNYRFHNHTSHYVFCVVLNGCVNFKLKNREINYYANESFTIVPYVPHSILLDKKSKLLSLCVGTQLFDEYTSDELLPIVEKVLCVILANMKHKVIANENGLYLFAKFLPALC